MVDEIDKLPPLLQREQVLRVTGLSRWTLDQMRELNAIRVFRPPGWKRKVMYFKCDIIALIRPTTQTATNGH